MTCHVFKGAGSENQSECVHCRQVDAERKQIMGRGKQHVIVLIEGGGGGGKEKNKPQNPQTKLKTLNILSITLVTNILSQVTGIHF